MNIRQQVKELFRSNGQRGKDGEPMGRGGENWCVCKFCGKMIEHKRAGEGKSEPCLQYRCPECGKSGMLGESEFDKLKGKKPEKHK